MSISRKKIFISSVQSEFSDERRQLVAYIRQDVMLGRYFDPFIFEELPAQDNSAQEAYLNEVADSDIYLGLYGERYGYEDAEGISPTEREYDAATKNSLYRIVLLKEVNALHPKEEKLIVKAESDLVRNTFANYSELQERVYAALVRYMVYKGILAGGPWDTTFHPRATIDDLDKEKISSFVKLARDKRSFPVGYAETNITKILDSALHLVSDEGRVTNAALLLFAKDPQKWFVSSVVKCAQFYGTQPMKPIPFQQIYRGNIFELVDQAVAFVMTHIDARVSDRSKSAQVDIKYELPVQAVTEAIVNAIVHRDYSSTGSVQVMLFRDRLEIWNPGTLPKGLTVEKLQQLHRSMPVNPLLAYPVYLAGYIEQMGTGTTDLINRCLEYGLPRPTFVMEDNFTLTIYKATLQDDDSTHQDGAPTLQDKPLYDNELDILTHQDTHQDGDTTHQDTLQDNLTYTKKKMVVTPQVILVYRAIGGKTLTMQQIMDILSLKDRVNFRQNYLQPALAAGIIEMTIPNKPTSKNQKYRLTEKGKKLS